MTTFHVEFRFPDGSDSPAQIVTQMFLFRVLLMKAVELSQFGVLRIDDEEAWRDNKRATVMLTDDSLQRGDRYEVSQSGYQGTEAATASAHLEAQGMTFVEAVAFAKEDARKLIASLRSHLLSIDGQSLGVLEKLVEKPVWARRASRNTWERIEESLMPKERVIEGLQQNILRVVTLGELTGVPNIANWKFTLSQALGVTQQEVATAFKALEQNVQMKFDREVGSYIMVW